MVIVVLAGHLVCSYADKLFSWSFIARFRVSKTTLCLAGVDSPRLMFPLALKSGK
jgi:hypothetical protein